MWVPSLGFFGGHNGVDASISNANIDKDYLKEGNSDSDEIWFQISRMTFVK